MSPGHYSDVIMGAMASQITDVSIDYWTVCSGADKKKKKKIELRVAGLCEGNSPFTGEFSSQRASNAENVFIWWRHHAAMHVGTTTVAAYLCVELLYGTYAKWDFWSRFPVIRYSIFWYEEFGFHKSNFWYQKIDFWYQNFAVIFWYLKFALVF